MINFPDAPQINDIYSEAGKTWKYNGAAWVGVGQSINNLVFTTGDQSIYGIKNFLNQANFSGIKFDTLTPSEIPNYQEGLVFYSDDYHTLNIYPDVPGLSLQVGQENWVRVKNELSQSVNIGSVVYITGTNGNNPGIQLSIATSEASSARTLGVVSNTMAPNNPGYVTTFGIVNGIDTRSYSVGQTLYLSTSGSGQFSSLKPTAPNHMVRVGTVLTSKNDGSIFVTVQNGFEVDELHDVSINGKTSGDFIKYNGSVWQNSKIAINDLSDVDTQTITPSSGNYLMWNGTYWKPSLVDFSNINTSNLVYATGNQTISGIKTFDQRPTLNGTGFLLIGEASSIVEDYYPNNNPSGFITTGNLTGYVKLSETGSFYPISNPSGFLTTATVSGSYVASVPTNISGASRVKNMIRITQSGYNALIPDAETLYIIVG
jgi:hypothetical protein